MTPEQCGEHVPERRERRNYDHTVILGDAWVCSRCEQFLNWVQCGDAREDAADV